jgi:hypothetical protein
VPIPQVVDVTDALEDAVAVCSPGIDVWLEAAVMRGQAPVVSPAD